MGQSRTGIVIPTIAITSAFWVGMGILIYWFWTAGLSDRVPPFAVTIEAPNTTVIGEEIDLTVKILNPTDEVLELGSIDFSETLLDGFTIQSIEPSPDSRDDSFGFITLYYKRILKPGESFEPRLTLKAESPGIWAGDIDCCTPLENFVTHSHTIMIAESLPEEE